MPNPIPSIPIVPPLSTSFTAPTLPTAPVAPPVSIVKYEKPHASIAKAVNLSGALDQVRAGDTVFVKPNLVFWSGRTSIPPWGVITTTRVVADVVRQLKERGAGQIIIGEGIMTLSPEGEEAEAAAAGAFEALGYQEIARRWQVRVENLFQGRFQERELPGPAGKLHISASLLEADYVVSVPVLKTHAQTVVSLSQKNLKGCLDMKSRKLCHSADLNQDLNFFVSRLADIVPRSCAIIDGIYTLERGPAYTGKARRSNILIASKDLLAADLAGALALGLDPGQVPHLVMGCARRGIAACADSITIAGEPLSSVASPHEWDFPYNSQGDLPSPFERIGIKGLSFPKHDHSLCSYCSGLVGLIHLAVVKAWRGKPFDGVEILTGKMQRPSPSMNHTVLFGECQVRLNRDDRNINHSILIPGCPPRVDRLACGLLEAGIGIDKRLFDNHELTPAYFSRRYKGNPEFSMDFYRWDD